MGWNRSVESFCERAWRSALRIVCQRCGAAVGQKCVVLRTGNAACYPHATRSNAAAFMADGRI
jgi:hypothetical protein